MIGQLVITEKASQAKDVRAAVGSPYGTGLPAEGHLFDLQESAATVTLAAGQRSVIGIGRVKAPTLAIANRRKFEIRFSVPKALPQGGGHGDSRGRPVLDAGSTQGNA